MLLQLLLNSYGMIINLMLLQTQNHEVEEHYVCFSSTWLTHIGSEKQLLDFLGKVKANIYTRPGIHISCCFKAQILRHRKSTEDFFN